MASRGLKICLAVSLLLLIIFTIAIVTLFMTIFKPKNPEITVHPVGLEDFQSSFSPNLTLNVTLGMIITIRNPNYGSFQYINSTSYVKFHDTVVAEVPIEAELVPARSQINVNTSADFMVAKLINDPNFLSDVLGGTLNFTSTIALPGKARTTFVLEYIYAFFGIKEYAGLRIKLIRKVSTDQVDP
ncbi:Late embryogenesis abundant protein [Glycine max]|nr:Late embryogenesis abundant protein [Glycine max]